MKSPDQVGIGGFGHVETRTPTTFTTPPDPEKAFKGFLLSQPATTASELVTNYLGSERPSGKLKEAEAKIITILHLHDCLTSSPFGLKFQNGEPRVFAGTHWAQIDRGRLRIILGQFAAHIGIPKIFSLDTAFHSKLESQCQGLMLHSTPPCAAESVLINLQNGTLEIADGTEKLASHSKDDHMSYVLPFDYDPRARCPEFQKFLNHVLPDPACQLVLAEFFGWAFLPGLKLEKMLVLTGSGQNGKSVVFDVIHSMLGKENISSLSLAELSVKENRFPLGKALLNYGSELNNKLDSANFKRLVSGEPVEARHRYHDVFTLSTYARLAFNANELPVGIEVNKAHFRRFLILPFDVTISDKEKDPDLAKKLCHTELPGIFNWVMDGMRRLHANRQFSPCRKSDLVLARYQTESDPVAMFVHEMVEKIAGGTQTPKCIVYAAFRAYCTNAGLARVSMIQFGKRLKSRHHVPDGKSDKVRTWQLMLKSDPDTVTPTATEPMGSPLVEPMVLPPVPAAKGEPAHPDPVSTRPLVGF